MSGYLARVKATTTSRFWVNNPTSGEAVSAIALGAVGSTTNPAFMASILRRAPEEILPAMRVRLAADSSDQTLADDLQLDLVVRLADVFGKVHESTGGQLGFVSIQGGPRTDHDPAIIVSEGLEARAARPNIVPKIPATAAGLDALHELAGRGHPCIVTEVFSLAQLVAVCERHASATKHGGVAPPLFISPITGIFGDHLEIVAAKRQSKIDARVIARAGVVLTRACQKMVNARGWPVTLLAGGARSVTDMTDLIGDSMHATINFSTAEQLEQLDLPIRETIREPDDPAVVDALLATFDSMRRALDPNGLSEGEFADFPPVLYFRDLFVDGWTATIDAIARERALLAAQPVQA